MAPILGYWKLRGLGQPIRLLLVHTGTEFDEKIYECGPAPGYDRSAWLDEKHKLGLAFPNLPYYIDGDLKITQSNAILRHIARLHNLDGVTEEEKIRVDETLYQLNDYKNKLIGLCYSPDFDKLCDNYLKDLPADLKLLSSFLGKHKYFAGENLTFVDFVVYNYLCALAVHLDVLDNFANLKSFIHNIEKLPTVSKYIENSETSKYPITLKPVSFPRRH